MRTESQYPGLEIRLQSFLLELTQAPDDFNQHRFEERLFRELEGVIPNFDRNKNTANQLFQLMDNELELQDQFTMDEIRDIVRLMVCVGYDVNAVDARGNKLLKMAIGFGDPEVVKILLHADAEVNTNITEDSNESMLVHAAYGYVICNPSTHPESKKNYRQIVQDLILSGAKKEQVMNSNSKNATEAVCLFVTSMYDEIEQHNSLQELAQLAALISASLPPKPVENAVKSVKRSNQPVRLVEAAEEVVVTKQETIPEKFESLFLALANDAEVVHSRSGKARQDSASDWFNLLQLIDQTNINTVRQSNAGNSYSAANFAVLFGIPDQLQSLVSRGANLNLPDAQSVLSSAVAAPNKNKTEFLLQQKLTFSTVNSAFEETLRRGNQKFAVNIVNAVTNAAKNPEKRLRTFGQNFDLADLSSANLPKLDQLHTLNKQKQGGKKVENKTVIAYHKALGGISKQSPDAKLKSDNATFSEQEIVLSKPIPVDLTGLRKLVDQEFEEVEQKTSSDNSIESSNFVVASNEFQVAQFTEEVVLSLHEERGLDVTSEDLNLDEFFRNIRTNLAGLFSQTNLVIDPLEMDQEMERQYLEYGEKLLQELEKPMLVEVPNLEVAIQQAETVIPTTAAVRNNTAFDLEFGNQSELRISNEFVPGQRWVPRTVTISVDHQPLQSQQVQKGRTGTS